MAAEQQTNITIGANAQPFVDAMKSATTAAKGFEDAVGQLGVASERSSQQVTMTAAQYQKLVQSLDPAARAAAQYAQAQTQVQRAVQAGLTTQTEANKLLDQAAQKYNTLAAQAQKAEQAQVEASKKAAAQQAAAYKSVEALLDPQVAKKQQLTQIEKVLNDELAKSPDKQQRINQLLGEATKQFGNLGSSAKVSSMQMMLAFDQVRQAGDQMIAGGGIFKPIIMQAPVAVQMLGGFSNTLGLLKQNIGAIAAGGGIAALVGGLTLLATAAERNQRSLNALATGLQTTRQNFATDAETINAAARKLAESTSYGTQEARDNLLKLVQAVPDVKMTTDNLVDLAKAMKDLGGGDAAAGVEKLIQVLNDPLQAALTALHDHVKTINAAFVEHVRDLINTGHAAQAAAETLQKLREASEGSGERATALETAWKHLTEALTRTGDAASGAGEGLGTSLVKALSACIEKAASLVDWLSRIRESWLNIPESLRQGKLVFGTPSTVPGMPTVGVGTATVGQTPSVGNLTVPQMTAVKAALSERESKNNLDVINAFGYVGQYQLGLDALTQLGYTKAGVGMQSAPTTWQFTGKGGVNSIGDFLKSADAQNAAMNELLAANYRALTAMGVITPETSPEVVGGLLASAHLAGAKGAADLYRNYTDTPDGFGTKRSTYYALGREAVRGVPAQPDDTVKPPATPKKPLVEKTPLEEAQASAEKFRTTGGLGSILTAGSLEEQKKSIQDIITLTEKQREVEGLSARDKETLTAKIEKLTAAYNSLETPGQKLVRTLEQQNRAATELDPVEREIIQRTQELVEANRAAGRETTDIEKNQVRVEVLKGLSAQYAQTYDAAQKEVSAQQAIAAAYDQSTAAGEHMTNMMRAQQEVAGKFPKGSAAYKEAVEQLAKKYDEGTAAGKSIQASQQIQQAESQGRLLDVQRANLSGSATQQAVANAEAQAKEQAKQAGFDQEHTDKLVRVSSENAAKTVDAEREKAAWNSVDQAATAALDSIAGGIETALETGKWDDWAKAGKQALSAISKMFIELALLNPLKNLLTGGRSNLPSLSDLFNNTKTGSTTKALSSMGGQFGPETLEQFQAAGGSVGGGMFSGIGDALSGAWNWFTNLFAKGAVFAASGDTFLPQISQYSGNIINKPTQFSFDRQTGLMGENGSEAVMPMVSGGIQTTAGHVLPLARTSLGKLAVDQRQAFSALSAWAASQGRGKDDMLAHINSREAMMLMARGGAGTRNPITGLMQFDDGGAGGGDSNVMPDIPVPTPATTETGPTVFHSSAEAMAAGYVPGNPMNGLNPSVWYKDVSGGWGANAGLANQFGFMTGGSPYAEANIQFDRGPAIMQSYGPLATQMANFPDNAVPLTAESQAKIQSIYWNDMLRDPRKLQALDPAVRWLTGGSADMIATAGNPNFSIDKGTGLASLTSAGTNLYQGVMDWQTKNDIEYDLKMRRGAAMGFALPLAFGGIGLSMGGLAALGFGGAGALDAGAMAADLPSAGAGAATGAGAGPLGSAASAAAASAAPAAAQSTSLFGQLWSLMSNPYVQAIKALSNIPQFFQELQKMQGKTSSAAAFASGAVFANDNDLDVPCYHTGGYVGQVGGVSRTVPKSAFSQARRYHAGGMIDTPPNFTNDEVPAILQRGEMVLTKGQQRAMNSRLGTEGYRPIVNNVTFHINTPDADSFRRSQKQINTEMARTMVVASKRM